VNYLLTFIDGSFEVMLYVIISNGEVIVGYKIQDFRFVLIYVYNYYRVALISFGDHSFVVD
jgi:hypothetical protein